MMGDGMVAVVHGLRDAGLAVTVMDGNHQYTLMPNHGMLTESQLKRNLGIACQMASVHVGTESNAISSNSSAQACDGRYTSVYRASHCNATPTSPPSLLTEFPPQKHFVSKGHGNFEVGGSGSGDKDYIPIKASGNFRGGMCWPDRGSVCSPRASHEPDAFANSLRKYPSMSPERSTEIVERLINYTQGKNSLRHQSKSITSPTRTVDSNISQNLDRSSRTISRSLQKNIYEPEVTLRVRRMEESPTRDRSRTRREECMKSIYGKTYDVRYVRDGVKREKARNPGFYVNAVNMEIQAAVSMVSREVATTPGVEPIKRTVAVPLSPITSSSRNPEGGVSQVQNENTYNFITTPTPVLTYPKSVQVTASSIEFNNIDYKKRLFDRKSKSHEDVRINANCDVVQLFKNLKPNNKTDKIILKGLDKVLDKVGTLNKGDKVQIKVGSVKKYINSSTSGKPVGKDEPRSSKPVDRKHDSNIFRAELHNTNGFVKSNVIDNIIKDWTANLNLKNRDFLNRNIDKEEILDTFRSRLQYIVYNRPKNDKIKGEIMEVLEDVPFCINGDDRKAYISNIVDTLLSSIDNIPLDAYPNVKLAIDDDEINNNERKDSRSKIKKDIQPTEEELKEFIVAELMDFLDKHDLKISFSIFDEVEMELVDILLDSIEAVRQGEIIYVKEEIIALVHEVNWFSAIQSKCFADTILAHLGNMLRGNAKESKIKSQTVLVLQNSCQNSSRNQIANNETDFSIGAITDGDIDNNLDYYMNQLTQQIDEWLGNLSLTCCTDKGFRQVVVNDLAAEIIDRHKYIERNPENRGTCKDELEHLRYEIYKWINKLVGEDNTSTLEHAPELMQRIRSIPVPMLTMPDTAHHYRPSQSEANKTGGNLNNSIFSPAFSSTKIGNVSHDSLKNKTPCQKCCGSREDSFKGGQGINQSQKKPSSSYSGTRVPGVNDGQMPMFGPSRPDGSMMEQQKSSSNSSRRMSIPGGMSMSGTCQMRSHSGFGPEAMGPSGMYSGNAMQTDPSGFDSGTMAQGGICSSGGGNQMFGPSDPAGSMIEQQGHSTNNIRRKSSPGGCAMSGACRQIPMRGPDGLGPEYFQMSPNNFYPYPMATCSGSQMPMFGPSGPGGNKMEQRELPRPNKRFSGPAGFASGPMVSGGTYPRQTGSVKSGSGACTNTRQPGTCCTDDDEIPVFGPTGPGGSMMEQRRRLSGPERFPSGPMASAHHSCGMYSSQMSGPQYAMGGAQGRMGGAQGGTGGFQGGMGGQRGSSGGMYEVTCCNDAIKSQGRVSTSGRGAPLPQCCQGQPQFWSEPGMNYSERYIGSSQMNSSQMPMTSTPGPGGTLSVPCGHKSLKRSLTIPSDSTAGPAIMDQPQTYGPNQSMFGGASGAFDVEGSPGSCCGGIQRGQMSMFEPQIPGGSVMQPRGPGPPDRRYSSPGALPTGYMNEVNPQTQCRDYSPTPCCPGMQVTPTMPSVIQLNEEYDEFVKNWVKDIPIPAYSPEEQAFADKARLGIYNGVWKSLTKLKFNPATFNNKFYYEDVFDDDIEELLGMLPPNPELDAKKHLLKVSLIEKTTTTNEILKSIIAPSMYRQQLVDNVANNLPKCVTDVRGEDPAKIHEELKILNIAEDYILFAKYKDDDKVKANIYKKKLLKKAEELVEEVKRTHGQELKDIDPGMYINDILSALHKVPVPSEETVKEEADEILLGLEIEQWFSDLPLVENDNYQEQLNRRRLRDALAKKIHEMEKVVNLADCSADRELKHEVSKFLEKLPLQRDQDLNINFMVDELTNRMKNRPREGTPGFGSGRKKSVAFEVPMDYEDFSRNMQCCSSFSDLPGASPTQFNQSSMNVQGARNQYGGAFQNDCCKSGQASNSMNQGRPIISSTPKAQSSQQWQTLNDSQAHCQICPPSRPCPQNQTYQDHWQTLNESQPSGQVFSAGRSSMAPNHTYESQGGFPEQQYSNEIGQAGSPQQPCPNQIGESSFAQLRCPSQIRQISLRQQSNTDQIGNAGTAQKHLPNQIGQPSSSQQFSPCQMGQATSPQQQRLIQTGQPGSQQQQFSNQMGQSSMSQQSGTCPMGQASISQQQYTNRIGQSGSAQRSGTCQMGQASSPQQRRLSQMGQASSYQQQFSNKLGQSSIAQQPGTCQMGQASPAQERCLSQMDRTQEQFPGQMGGSSVTKSCCLSPMAQASSAQQRRLSQLGQGSSAQQQIGQPHLPQQYPDQMDQSSSALQSDYSEMGQVVSGQRSGQKRGGSSQPKTDNQMDQSNAQSCCPKPMNQSSPAQRRLSQSGQGRIVQQQGSGPFEMDSEMEKPNVSQQTYQGPNVRRYSRQPQEQFQNQEQQPAQQKQRKCENCSPGGKNTASSRRISLDNKRSVSSHNISKIGTVRDHLQSPKTVLRRHSKCFEELPQPYQKTSGRSNLNQRGKAFDQANRRPRTPNRSSQTTRPSDQNFCGPTCPSTLAAKSSSNTVPQDANSPEEDASNAEYVQGHRLGQKQGRVSNAQPIGYSTPREGVSERRRPTDGQRQEEGRIEVEDMEEEVETERDESRCRCMERMFRYVSLSASKLNRFGRLDHEGIRNARDERRNFDPEDRNSSTNIKKCIKCNKIKRSRSQEMTTKVLDIRLNDDVLEWFQLHGNTTKVKMWGEKLQRIADKLQFTNEQEKLKNKIERYLNRVPSQFSECDDDRREFRKQLPEQLIRRLRRFYSKNKQKDPLNIYHVEMPNYYSKIRTNQDELRSVLRSWLKTIYFKRRDFLGRPIRRDDVIDFIEYKLQPFITDKSNSEQEYKYVLKSKIIEAVNELPVAISGECLDRQADKLIEEILNVTNIAFENKDNKKNFKNKHIRPAIKEIKDFITDQILQYLEQNNITLRASKIFRLEMDLTDILTDLYDTSGIRDSVNVKRRVLKVMRKIGKLTMIRAVDFTDTLINNFRKTYYTVNNNLSNYMPHECYSVYVQNRSSKRQHAGDLCIGDVRRSSHALKGVNYYNKQLVHQINEWLKDIQVPKQNKASKDTAVKQLAADIVDRHKYLELNPDSRGTEPEELEHLKFQIFKWINNLVGEDNKTTLERAPDLMNRIQSVPVPLLSSQQRSQNYVSHLTDVIFEWYHDLPTHLHSSDDETMRKQNVKNLAENIEKAMKTKKSVNETVNKEVNIWTKKVFMIQPDSLTIDQLKVKLKAVLNKDENNLDKDTKQEKLYIRRYEDVIDDWLDTFPLEPKREASFINIRNEYIHDLAVKLHNSRTKLENASPDVLNKKLQEEVSDWLKKIPLHQQTNKKAFRDQFSGRLIRKILESNQEESLEMREKVDSTQFSDTQLEDALIDWLKTLPLYREKSITEKQKQEKIMSELAKRLNSALHGHSNCNPDLEIENHVKMLGLVFLNDREYVQKTALQLKLHLQNLNFFADISQRKDPNDDEFLDANIEVWMRNLPLNVPSDVERRELENKKKAFAKTMKELKANRANDDVLIGEIVNFMKTLPLSKTDDFFLKEEANMLIKSLYAVAMGHVPRNKPPTSNEFVRDVISNWSVLLPLKPIYSPVELRSLIDQMTREITDQIVTPDHSVEEKIKQKTLDYLRKFPIKPERRDEQQLEKMALALLNDIKDVQLYRSDYSGEINKPIDNQQSKNSNDVIPPKLSTQSDSEKENVGPNLDEYMIRLTTEIKEWLNDLRGQIPEIHDKSFREIAINDLAGDIVDRHKYLELNPTIRGSDEDELEHLKYQIFKWINKLVGEDNLVTIEHASELMDKIRSISTPVSATTIMRGNPVMASTPAIEPPLNNEVCVDAIDAKKLPPKNQSEAARDRNHVKAQINGPASEHAQSMTPKRSSNNESREGTCQTVPNRGPSMHNETTSHTLTCVSEGKDVILTTHDIQVGQTSTSTATYDAGSMIYSQETLTDRVNPSTQKNASQVFRPSYLDLEGSIDESPREIKSTPNTNQASTQLPIVSPRRSSSEIVSQKSQPYEVGSPRKDSHPENFPPGMTVIEVHKQYDGIIRELCAQLPFKADTPDEERIADLARKGVYNTIWKTYFKFKSDPELENDYVYMEFLLEGTIDDCLDIVTNSEIENMRQAWKGKMILHVMDMIKCVQSISDTPSFREQLGNKMDRLFTKELFSEVEYQVSQMFISRIAESYILYANYKYEDPVKANIYRHRLMKRLEVFVQEQTKLHNKEFRKLDDVKMCQKAFKILESIPLPTNDVLKAEADEVLLNEEIESWYHDLPVQPLESQHDERFRRRMLEVLAKKIREMEKRPGIDESSLQMEMKHEMSVFLKKRARLQKDEDLNINFMVDELTNRLKNRKNREINYEGFQKDVPLSSTFEEMESVDALAPLVDCRPLSQIGNGCGSGCRRRSRRGILGTSQVNAQSNQYISEQPLMQPMNQHSSFSNPTFEYKSFDGITQSAGLSNMNQMPTQQYDQNSGYTSTYYPYAQSHSCMQQQNQMPLEYAFSPNQMPQMAPYPGQEPHLNVSEYSTRLTPDGIVSNLQQPVQFTRSSLPKQMPSYPYLGAEMPGVKATPLSARVSDVIMSRDIPDVNMQMEEEEMRDNEREESRCRCVEYCRRRRTRICIPYNDRRRCYPSYPMPMPFPFNCFY